LKLRGLTFFNFWGARLRALAVTDCQSVISSGPRQFDFDRKVERPAAGDTASVERLI